MYKKSQNVDRIIGIIEKFELPARSNIDLKNIVYIGNEILEKSVISLSSILSILPIHIKNIKVISK